MTLGADLVARGVHSLPASFTKRNQWNKAVSEAEKLVSSSNWPKLLFEESWKADEQLKIAEIIFWRTLKSWWGAETAWNHYLNKRTFTFTFTGEQLKLVEIFVRKKLLSLLQVGYPTSLLSVRALLDNDFANIAVSLILASLINLKFQHEMKVHLRFV